MYIATTLMIDLDAPEKLPETVTFTTQDHEPGHLISLIGRYMKLTNELNETNIQYRLIGVSDIGQAITISVVELLDVINISREKITELRSEKMGKTGGYRVSIPSNAQELLLKMSDVDLGIDGKEIYTLPKVDELPENLARDVKGMNPVVYALIKGMNSNYLLDVMVQAERPDLVDWVLIETLTGNSSRMPGQCYLVEVNKTFYLSATKPS